MGLIYVILFVVGLAGTVGWLAYQHAEAERRARLWIWRVAAVGSGVNVVAETPGNLVLSPTITGRAGPLYVRLERYRPSRGKTGTRILVEGFSRGQGALELRRQGLLDGLRNDEVTLGAPDFDREVYLQGDADRALAIFDAETRWKVLDLLRGLVTSGEKRVPVKAAFRGETLEVLFDESPYAGEDRLAEAFRGVLAAVLDVARRLVLRETPLRQIAANLASEPEPGVRLAGVRRLVREVYRTPALWDPLVAACQDPSPEVRLEAAAALGSTGHGTLRALVAEEATDDTVAARAVAALGDGLTVEATEAELRRALARHRGATARACLEALASRGRSDSEALLLEALASADQEVAVAAARALGQVGTAAAVAALREGMPVWPGERRDAARRAIELIQARLVGAAAGQLSLAGGEAGALSLAAQGDAGRLSLSGEEPAASEPAGTPIPAGGEAEGDDEAWGRPRAGREPA